MNKIMLGINIFSGTKGLGGVLTNPTELAFKKGSIKKHYPITYHGRTYADSENAYQAYKTRFDSHADKQVLMIQIIIAKLEQHPKLVEQIAKRGGARWLERCSHHTSARNELWEGDGLKSAFIRCLYCAYLIITNGKDAPNGY